MTTGLLGLELRPGHPDFLDLPWHLPVGRWREACARCVEVERGLSRHEVAFVQYGEAVYVAKELPPETGEREYAALRWLEDRDLPAVVAVGHARTSSENGGSAVLLTRFLDGSLPFRSLFAHGGLEQERAHLLDAIAGLLVRLHLAGFYWGDCSLSNTLFRRAAGELQAYLVDAETAEMHPGLSDGQRRHDLSIVEDNVAGDLHDVAAMLGAPASEELWEAGREIAVRYERLWWEITREETITPGESWRINDRIRRLNALGFTVGEVKLEATGDGSRLRMRTIVTDQSWHRNQLHALTGLLAEDRQASLLVNDIQEMAATLAREQGRSLPLAVAAFRWLRERWDPTVRALASRAHQGVDLVQLYCNVLEHKWYMSEAAGRDVGLAAAVEDYLARFGDDDEGRGEGRGPL
jgi:Domain of unknown function (DUF4032)/Lipopolysaccharide kinase (Kdo/WaaP) family